MRIFNLSVVNQKLAVGKNHGDDLDYGRGMRGNVIITKVFCGKNLDQYKIHDFLLCMYYYFLLLYIYRKREREIKR